MKNVKIKGLDETSVSVLLTFMNSKLTDENYIRRIEKGGNDCDMTWMEDDMDISGDDMIHELFEMYGKGYALEIGDCIFTTDGYDEYECVKKLTNEI